MAGRRNIGREIVAARAAGVPWKSLERRYKLSRSRLYQLWWKAAGRSAARGVAAGSCPRCGFDPAKG